MHKTSSTGTWVPELDGLRGVAIGLVILFHLWFNAKYPSNTPWTSIPEAGWMGVDVFFVLSGFLITRILLQTKGRDHYYSRFVINRVLRILPLYTFSVAFSVLAHLAHNQGRLTNGDMVSPLWMLTFTQNWQFGLGYASVATMHDTWSLAIEEQFYLCWPAIVAVLNRKQLATFAVAVILFSPLCRMLTGHFAGTDAVYYWTACRIDGLAFGACAALLTSTDMLQVNSRHTKTLAPLLAPILMGWIVLTILSGKLMLRDTSTFILLGYSNIVACTTCVLLATHYRVWPTLNWILRRKPLVFLGKISYGLYITNEIAIMTTYDVVRRTYRDPVHSPSALTAYVVIAVLLCLILSWVSWHYLEEPIKERKDQVLQLWIRQSSRVRWSQPKS